MPIPAASSRPGPVPFPATNSNRRAGPPPRVPLRCRVACVRAADQPRRWRRDRPPPPIIDPSEPQYVEPPAPPGLFGKKKKHAEAIEVARAQYEQAHRAWQAEVAWLPARRQAAADEHAKSEQLRVQRLEAERTRYAAECTAREAEAADKNAALDALISNLGVRGDRSHRGVHLDCSVELGVPGAFPRPPRVHVRPVYRGALAALPRPRPEPHPHDEGVQVREGRR